jgi:hypothetical protein
VNGWEVFWGATAGLVGAAVGAGATVWATLRTLREQARIAAEERAATTENEFDFAKRRADQQYLSALTALRIIEVPQVPFIKLNHDAFEELLRFPQLPDRVAHEIERLTMALRSYNAAADLANAKFPLSGANGPAEQRWREAQTLADVAAVAYEAWRGDELARPHPLADN